MASNLMTRDRAYHTLNQLLDAHEEYLKAKHTFEKCNDAMIEVLHEAYPLQPKEASK